MLQWYDPAAISNLAFPIGVYIDRLSAVMMVLITGVTALLYRYSTRRVIVFLWGSQSCVSLMCHRAAMA